MNDSPHAGGHAPNEPGLVVKVRAKVLTSADGLQVEVLRVLGFTVARGETVALVGPSGCGKTTLLRMIAGLDLNFDGDIRLPASHRLGMVFQEPRLLPWRSVEANVRLVAPDASALALDSLFAALDLSAHRNMYPGELSLGLARRVALARAFAVEPDVLLLDEPFVSLDEALASQMRAQLSSLIASRNVTTLLVTHDIEEAMVLADRIIVLSGRPAMILDEINANAFLSATDMRSYISSKLKQTS